MNLEECMWATCIAGIQNIRMWKEYFEALSCEIILNPAIGKFTGDARHQGRRRINILQALDNEADSVKLPIPQGKKIEKKAIHPTGERKKSITWRQQFDFIEGNFFHNFLSAGFRFMGSTIQSVNLKQAIANWQESSTALRESMDGLLKMPEGD